MELVKRLELFLTDIERESYLVFAGLKDDANFTDIYNQHKGLVSRETIETVKAADMPEGEKAEILAFLYTAVLGEEQKEAVDALLTAELSETIEVEGKKHPFRNAPALIANAQTHAERGALDAARAETQRRMNPELVRIEMETHRIAGEFGFGSYTEFFEKTERVALAPLKAEAEKFLAATNDMYHEWKERACGECLDVPAREARAYDMVFLRRAGCFDGMFPASTMVDTVWRTMLGMGIDCANDPRIRVDVEARPKKSPRAFCCAVRVPEEVYLVILPHGGTDDYSSFLHELGHTLHYAHTDPALPFSARYLGDNSVTEGHAGTLENLLENPAWLRDFLGIADPKPFIKFTTFIKLYLARRYCGKLQYETALHGGATAAERWPELYASTLSDATGVEYDPSFFLQDVDSHLYCARYLRAWMLEGRMRRALEREFGERWFTRKDAGDFLRGIWGLGQSENAEAIARRIGFEALDLNGLAEECRDVWEM